MPPLLRREVTSRRVHRQTVIPNNKRARLVRRPDLVVRALSNMVKQELEQELRLFLLEPDDPAREALVDVQSLLTRDGVHADDGMLALDGLSTDGAVVLAREIGLVHGGVDGAQALEALLELEGETLVGLDLRQEEGVTAAIVRLLENPEEGRARGLQLIRLRVVWSVRRPVFDGGCDVPRRSASSFC